jgi:hypothetical protein
VIIPPQVQLQIDETKRALTAFMHVRSTVIELPDSIAEGSTKSDFVRAVETMPVPSPNQAAARMGYVEYLKRLNEEKYKQHLLSALHIRKRAKAKREVHVPGREAVRPPDPDVQKSG